MALNDEFLTQDIDILPDEWTTWQDANITDILPDAPEEAAPVEETPVEETVPTEEPTTDLDPELEALFASSAESSTDAVEQISEAWDKIQDAKEKIEEVQANPANLDTTELLKEMYQDLLETETALSAAKIAEDVARTKVSELQAQVSNLEIDAAW